MKKQSKPPKKRQCAIVKFVVRSFKVDLEDYEKAHEKYKAKLPSLVRGFIKELTK